MCKRGLASEEPCKGQRALPNALRPGPRAEERRCARLDEPTKSVLGGRDYDIGLVGELVIERPTRHSCRYHDVRDRRTAIALLSDRARRACQKSLACRALVATELGCLYRD